MALPPSSLPSGPSIFAGQPVIPAVQESQSEFNQRMGSYETFLRPGRFVVIEVQRLATLQRNGLLLNAYDRYPAAEIALHKIPLQKYVACVRDIKMGENGLLLDLTLVGQEAFSSSGRKLDWSDDNMDVPIDSPSYSALEPSEQLLTVPKPQLPWPDCHFHTIVPATGLMIRNLISDNASNVFLSSDDLSNLADKEQEDLETCLVRLSSHLANAKAVVERDDSIDAEERPSSSILFPRDSHSHQPNPVDVNQGPDEPPFEPCIEVVVDLYLDLEVVDAPNETWDYWKELGVLAKIVGETHQGAETRKSHLRKWIKNTRKVTKHFDWDHMGLGGSGEWPNVPGKRLDSGSVAVSDSISVRAEKLLEEALGLVQPSLLTEHPPASHHARAQHATLPHHPHTFKKPALPSHRNPRQLLLAPSPLPADDAYDPMASDLPPLNTAATSGGSQLPGRLDGNNDSGDDGIDGSVLRETTTHPNRIATCSDELLQLTEHLYGAVKSSQEQMRDMLRHLPDGERRHSREEQMGNFERETEWLQGYMQQQQDQMLLDDPSSSSSQSAEQGFVLLAERTVAAVRLLCQVGKLHQAQMQDNDARIERERYERARYERDRYEWECRERERYERERYEREQYELRRYAWERNYWERRERERLEEQLRVLREYQLPPREHQGPVPSQRSGRSPSRNDAGPSNPRKRNRSISPHDGQKRHRPNNQGQEPDQRTPRRQQHARDPRDHDRGTYNEGADLGQDGRRRSPVSETGGDNGTYAEPTPGNDIPRLPRDEVAIHLTAPPRSRADSHSPHSRSYSPALGGGGNAHFADRLSSSPGPMNRDDSRRLA